MRNLFHLFWKYHFFILFLVLEMLSGYFIFQNNNFQKTSFINSSNIVVAGILSAVKNITEYVNLKNTNASLSEENAKLLSLIPSAFYNDNNKISIIKDTATKQQYYFVSAKVINNSTSKRNNYLTLNRGSAQGIKPEMGVVSSNGIVGIVKDVSEHFCTVISVLHKDFRTSAKIRRNNYSGNLEWRGGKPTQATIIEMPKHVKLMTGDTMITSSYSSVFPEGINIGTIEKYELGTGDNFYTITVNLTTDFQKLDYVYIVANLLKQEQDSLEFNSFREQN